MAAAFGAAASWLCCMPLALGVLGTAGSGLARVLGPLQPWVTALSLILLAVAFVQAYRRPPGTCAGNAGCDPARVRRTRRFLWLAAALTAALVTVPYWMSWVIFWSL